MDFVSDTITVADLRRKLTEHPEDAKVFAYVKSDGHLIVQSEPARMAPMTILEAKVDLGGGGGCR